MSVEVGQWHRLESLESGTVILECKDGKYEPLSEEDVLEDEGREMRVEGWHNNSRLCTLYL